MANPWDAENLSPNLATIAGLQPGQKLGLLKKGEGEGAFKNLAGSRGLRERFKIQSGKIGSLVRLRKRESMGDQSLTVDPLVKFFQEAVNAYAASDVSGGEVAAAADALLTLRDTYRKSGNTAERNAAEMLVARVQALIPLELRTIVIHAGAYSVDILTDPRFVPIRNSLKGFLTKFEGTSVAEHQDPTLAAAVFGNAPAPPKATTLPAPPGAYKRKALGVCQVFHRDFIVGTNTLKYGGQKMTPDAPGLRALLQYLGGDEAMLFLVSQVACQGGLPALFTSIANSRTLENERAQRHQCLFLSGTTQFSPAAYNTPPLSVTRQGGVVVVSCKPKAELGMPGFEQLPNNPYQAGASSRFLTSFGLTALSAFFEVALARSGDRLTLAFRAARIDISATPPPPDDQELDDEDDEET